MAAAYVLINTSPGKTGDAHREMEQLPGVKSAHVVTGAYDIIVYIEGGDISELGNQVVSHIQSIDGVMQTMTCVVVELPR